MRVLAIAPHADDETLGMGGTIARLVREGHDVHVALMTGAGKNGEHPFLPKEGFETVRREFHQALDVLGVQEKILCDLPAVLVEKEPIHVVNDVTKKVVERVAPERLYLPFPYDLHRDHRELFYSFSVHARAYLTLGQNIKEIYCYETPSETHLSAPYLEPAFTPNAYVDISAFLDTKLAALKCYESQAQAAPLPRSPVAIEALARLRGSQVGVAAAEAFVLIRKNDL
jgi:LmbE family N-acetylglucosaminyl deacetylase